MRKFTLLFTFVIIASFIFGQSVQKSMKMKKTDEVFEVKKQTNFVSPKSTIVWSNDFSTEADWLIGHVEGAENADWIITTEASAPADYIPVYGMAGVITSTTAENGFALFNSDITGGEGGELQNAWIQIVDPVDLTSLTAPRFVFTTYYKKFEDQVFFEYSINGGTDWTSVQLFSDFEVKDISATDYQYLLNIPELGGESSVLFRFRFSGDWDYGMYIDDLYITETPDYDLVLKSCAINFFEVVDYNVSGQEDYYHISSHLGMIPDEILKNENAWMIFNTVVTNNGINNAFPSVDVTVTDPDEVEIYNFTFTSDIELAPGEQDTLDIAWGEDEEFYVTPELFKLGMYNVDFDLFIDGIDDNNPENNSYSTYFESTDYTYALDGGNFNGVCGPGIWLDGDVDGALMGVNYTFFTETTIDSVQAFITSTSDAGTALLCHLYQFDTGTETWANICSSTYTDITAEDLGTWKTFTFTDPAAVIIDEGETSKTIKIGLEFYYNGGNDLWIGQDNIVPSSFWGTQWWLVGDDSWASFTNYTKSTPMIRAYITPTLTSTPTISQTENISIYPNPSSGIVTISNVEGATIEIINLMGQIVKTVNSSYEVNNIDLSEFANGTYFVKVVKGNNVSTLKVNLVK